MARRDEPLVVQIGLREIYDILVRLDATVGRLADQHEETRTEVRDHEERMRILERARWPLPTVAALVALMSLALGVLRQDGG